MPKLLNSPNFKGYLFLELLKHYKILKLGLEQACPRQSSVPLKDVTGALDQGRRYCIYHPVRG